MAANPAALCAAAESALLAGDGVRAAGLLDEAAAGAADPVSRADALCLRARVAVTTGEHPAILVRLLAEAEALSGEHPVPAARLLLEAAVLAVYGRHSEVLAIAQRAHALASGADPVLRARAETVLGIAYNYTGHPEVGRRHLGGSVEVIRLGGSTQDVVHLLQLVVVGLAGLENYADALALCRQYTSAVRRIGADGLLPLVLSLLANTAYFTADFDVMEMAASEALMLARSHGQQPPELYARVCLGLALAVKGETDAAREHIGRALELIDATGARTFVSTAHLGLALLELGAGCWSAGAAHLAQVRRALDDLPTVSGTLHWRADEVEALWRAGDLDAARRAHAALTDGLEHEGPWERAAAARTAALLAGAGDPAEAEARFAEAFSWHDRSSSGFERARTELCRGEWLAGQGRIPEAARQLESAHAAFTALGARPWAEQAAAQLAGLAPTSGAPDPRPDDAAPAGIDDGAAAPGECLIRAFGPMTVIRGGEPIRVAMDTPGRVLRYLVAHGGSVHADQLADELWPDDATGQGATRLRNVLSRVRARYGPLLTRDGGAIHWAEGVRVDADRFLGLARTAQGQPRGPSAAALAREAVALYRGELLALERDAPWAASARERTRQRYVDLLALLVEDAIDRGDLPAAIGHARDLAEANPLDEDAHLTLARLQLDSGRPAAARESVARARAVAAELGLSPSAALLALERRTSTTAC